MEKVICVAVVLRTILIRTCDAAAASGSLMRFASAVRVDTVLVAARASPLERWLGILVPATSAIAAVGALAFAVFSLHRSIEKDRKLFEERKRHDEAMLERRLVYEMYIALQADLADLRGQADELYEILVRRIDSTDLSNMERKSRWRATAEGLKHLAASTERSLKKIELALDAHAPYLGKMNVQVDNLWRTVGELVSASKFVSTRMVERLDEADPQKQKELQDAIDKSISEAVDNREQHIEACSGLKSALQNAALSSSF